MPVSPSAAGKTSSEVEILNISEHGIWILVHEIEYFMDYKKFPWFADANIKQILNVELSSKTHLYWPDLDIDLSTDILARPEKFPLLAK